MPSLSTITRAVATTEDRRGTLAAAGMIAAVVAVLAFGSGSWGRIARLAGDSALPAGRDLGTAVQPLPGATAGSGEVAVGVVPGARGSSGARSGSSSSTSTASASSTSSSSTTSATRVPTTTAGTATPSPTVVAASCSAGAVTPFWIHFEKAHLETSPGQQVADALDVDQYVKTHTVLLDAMLSPVIQAIFGSRDDPGPFWTHLRKAHLEAGPGQQVVDALALDQYVQTHTVLVEDMLAPIVGESC